MKNAPLKEEIDRIVSRTVPEDVARERLRHLVAHADAVTELAERAKRVYREMLASEASIMAFDGMSPRLAEMAAKNNLGVRKADLDVELAEAVRREDERLHDRLKRLLEDAKD